LAQGGIPANVSMAEKLLHWIWATILVSGYGIAAATPPASGATGPAARQADWPAYLGNKARNLYSPLAQIDRSNVARLEVAWSYDTGEQAPYQTNNLIIGRVLYTVAPASRRVIALDAASGRELWVWNGPKPGEAGAARQVRGLVYWENEQGGEQRLFSAVGSYLYCLKPATGELIRSFGDNGASHLGKGLDELGTPAVNYNTPGVTYQDLLIFGVSSGSPRGIRAMDTRTGEIRWHFHTAPRPGGVWLQHLAEGLRSQQHLGQRLVGSGPR
jgi:quinoprotein glucose dehydrogenase